MESVRQTRSRKSSLVPPAKENEAKDNKKPGLKKQKSNNAKAESPEEESELEIPTLDDMTSLLFANEAIESDAVPQLNKKEKKAPAKQKAVAKENETEENPSVSTRIGEKSDSSSTFNQSTTEESKKELENLLKMAQALASSGDFAQAINYYNRAVTINEKSGAAWIAMGHCYAMIGQDQKALSSYEQALRRVPSSQKDEQLWYGVGSLYQKFEDWNNAEMSFRNALRLDPNNSLKGELFYNLGLVMKAKGDFPDSIKNFNKAVVSGAFASEKIVEILGQIADSYEIMDDAEGMMKTYSYSLMVQESNPIVLMKAGWLSFQNEKIDQALNYLKKAEQLMPDDARISYVIARCYLKQKAHTTAYDILHKCLTKEAASALYWSSLGILFGELSQLKQCYDCLTKAVKGDPKCPEHFYNLGCLFELSNQLKDAGGMYDKAVELQPNFTLALSRKMNLANQLNNKSDVTLEVQFKHAPFSLIPEKKKVINSLIPIQTKSDNTLLNAKSIGSGLLSGKLEGLKVGQENKSNKSLNGFSGSVDTDTNSFKLPKPMSSETNKLPSSAQSLNGFSFLQNNYNNVNNFLINPMFGNKDGDNNSEAGVSSLAPSRVMTDELTSFLKNGSTDFAKQLSGLQALLAKNNPSNSNLQSNSLQSMNIDSLKATRQSSSPIVLKHPQVLSINESVKTNLPVALGKPASKLEFKVNARAFKSNEDDFEPSKKLKKDEAIQNAIPSMNN